MSHIVKREPWATIDINLTERRIFVREDWQYTWTTEAGQPDWTPEEQHNFHHLVDRSIWAQWSWRPLIRVHRTHSHSRSPGWQLREELARSPLPVTFDVRRGSALPHWTVTVEKVDPNTKKKPQAQVYFAKKTILLYSTDLLVHRAKRFMGDQWHEGFKVHPHEFGHTFRDRDEYEPDSAFLEDLDSIMNVGRSLRPRHMDLLCQTLHTMVPGCEFVPFISSGTPASRL